MALPIPNTEAAMAIVVGHDAVVAAQLSITARYSDQNSLLCMLDNIGLGTKKKFDYFIMVMIPWRQSLTTTSTNLVISRNT